MRKIFLTLTLILTMLTATAFAAESEPATENQTETESRAHNVDLNGTYEYTSETYGFKITCPAKPVVVVKPFEDPNKEGELLVFANEGIDVLLGYIIELDAFDNAEVPDFNKGKKKVLEEYLKKMREDGFYNSVEIRDVATKNKGVVMVTAKELEVLDDKGEVQDTITAEEQRVITYFRTKSGRCIAIQLIDSQLDNDDYLVYRKSVATYQDSTDLAKSDKKSDKKSKKK